MGEIAHSLDVTARAVALFADMYRNQPNLVALAGTYLRLWQDLEDEAWAVMVGWALENAEGLQLRTLGKLVGQPYQGESDDTYRLRIKARVRLNRCNGGPEQIYTIFRLLVTAAATLRLEPAYPAGYTLYLGNELVTAEQLALYGEFLYEATGEGIGSQLVYSTALDEDLFAFDGGTGKGWGDASDPLVGGVFSGVI